MFVFYEKSDMVFIPDPTTAVIDPFVEIPTLTMCGDVCVIGEENKPFDQYRLIRHIYHISKFDFDFHLTGTANFMVVVFHIDPPLIHLRDWFLGLRLRLRLVMRLLTEVRLSESQRMHSFLYCRITDNVFDDHRLIRHIYHISKFDFDFHLTGQEMSV